MPATGQTTKAKRYWVGVVTDALQKMPETYRQQMVIDYINQNTGPHPYQQPADVTIKAYVKEINDSAINAPWMDEPWNMGAVTKLAILGIRLDASDIHVLSDLLGYTLINNLPLTARQAVWAARICELVDDQDGLEMRRLYSWSGRYAANERASLVLHEPMNSELLDAELALFRRPGVQGWWGKSVALEMLLAGSQSLANRAVESQVRVLDTLDEIPPRWLQEPTHWLDACALQPFSDPGVQDALMLAIVAFIRSSGTLKLSFDDSKKRVSEIYDLVNKREWELLWDSFGYVNVADRAILEQQKADEKGAKR